MNLFNGSFPKLSIAAPLLLSALLAGCGASSTEGQSAVLGPPGGALGSIVPGAVCSLGAGPTIPTVTVSNPTSGDQTVPTSDQGIAGGGKVVTATFSLAMNPATISAANFALAPTGGAALIPASVQYDASSQVATLTTASALQPGTNYTTVIKTAVTSAAGAPLSCAYAWNFKTVTPVATGIAPNLGRAAPFAIAATAGVTNTATAPITHLNGNAVLDPNDTCNAVAVDNVGGFGTCGGDAPTINGSVITPTYPDTTTANAVFSDLKAAFLEITPPAGPPAAGSLGGGTPIAAPTGLGAVTGSALVPGQNVFYPGVYTSNTSIMVSNDLTLDAQGNPDAVFVFQSASTIGAAAGAVSPGTHTRILLINGAKASNVWWQAGSSATLGTAAEWQGNILAAASVTMQTSATSCGRLLAGAFTAGAFAFDSNLVSVPGNINAPASCQ